MSLADPDTIRAEQHTEIGTLLCGNVGIVLARWAQRAAAEQPNAQRVHHDVLLDHLTELLQSLGQSLIASEAMNAVQHHGPAVKHGEQRWDAHWSLAEVIRDYQILRLVLLEFLEENLDRALRFREVLAVGLALDEAITASATAYARIRDEERTKEMERIQSQLKAHAEDLQKTDALKNEFLAVLAHELRNPLAPVQNAVQVLRLKNSPDPDLQWARDIIERQAQLLTRMVDDLSDISRIAHGKVRLDKSVVAIDTVLRQAVEGAQVAISSRKHRLSVEIPQEPIWVDGDPQRLIQVFVNLLINSAKYTDEGGEIHLSAERRVDEVAIKVRDNGIGMASELLPRIFEPFVQAQLAAARVQGGLGLGLALVRKLVDLHGGRVQAFSQGRGTGSEFVVILPTVSLTPQHKPVEALGVEIPEPTRRILVVDDNRDAAQSLGMLLKMIGHDVHVAHDGQSALDMARLNPPEVAVLDIGMPGMSGLEVGRRLREDLGLKDVLLVALTGYGQNQDRERSKAAGFNVHLVKPIEPKHLFAVLRHYNPRSGLIEKGETS